MKSSSNMRLVALLFFLAYAGFCIYGALGQATIGCNVTAAGTCPFTMVLYIQNDTGGHDNAHAQNVSVAGYAYGVCCNTSSGSVGVGCGTNFLELSATDNAHVEWPGTGSYPVDTCISHSAAVVRCLNVSGSCPASTNCLLSYASSGGNNATNAHVAACNYYVKNLCCSLKMKPFVSQMVLNSSQGTNRSTENLNCYAKIIDLDNATVNAYWQWWKGGVLMFSGMNTSITQNKMTLITTLLDGNTSYGDVWNCSIRATDGIGNATAWVNRTLTINTPPAQPALIQPAGAVHNRYAKFNWTPSNDTDGDTLSYILNITCFGCSADNRIITGITDSNYTLTSRLKYFGDDNYRYNWTVLAYDGSDNSTGWRSKNFTLYSVVMLSLNKAELDFGTMNPNDLDNTSDGNPAPFVLQNDGNCFSDVKLSAQMIWETVTTPSSYYRFKADNQSGSETTFNVNWTHANSTREWTKMQIGAVKFLDYFNWSNATDTVDVDIELKVPPDEVAGDKGSWMTITGFYAREEY